MSRLQIIIGSTRPTRAADRVAPWVVTRAIDHSAFAVEVLDLRDWPLPTFAEHVGTIGDFSDPTYSEPIVRRWNHKVKEADAYMVITPEYNHSIPGVLKNAIDSVFVSFALRNKPLVTVGYSGGIAGGVRAIEHMAQIAIEAKLVPLRSSVIIPHVVDAFDEDGEPVDPVADISLGVALDDLAWWSSALERARADGELLPVHSEYRQPPQPSIEWRTMHCDRDRWIGLGISQPNPHRSRSRRSALSKPRRARKES